MYIDHQMAVAQNERCLKSLKGEMKKSCGFQGWKTF